MHRSPRIVIFLLLALSTAKLWADPSTKTAGERTDELQRHLQIVEQAARADRIIGGSAFWVAAGLAGVAAGLSGQSSIANLRRDGPFFFGVLAAGFAIGGTLTFFIPRGFETGPEEYRSLPERTAEDLKKKAAAGEEILGALSERARFERLLRGAVSAGVGAALLASYAAKPPLLGGAEPYLSGFALFISLTCFLSESVAETQWREYQTGVPDAEEFSWGVLPKEEGAGAFVAWKF